MNTNADNNLRLIAHELAITYLQKAFDVKKCADLGYFTGLYIDAYLRILEELEAGTPTQMLPLLSVQSPVAK